MLLLAVPAVLPLPDLEQQVVRLEVVPHPVAHSERIPYLIQLIAQDGACRLNVELPLQPRSFSELQMRYRPAWIVRLYGGPPDELPHAPFQASGQHGHGLYHPASQEHLCEVPLDVRFNPPIFIL